jgi:hypothetical protein
MLPDVRYRVMALSTGWIKRAAKLFRENKLAYEYVLMKYDAERSPIRFDSDCAFKQVTEWVAVRLACYVAPDNSIDASDAISGVFEHLDAEFYRRIGGPYEDMQIEKNEDLPQYKKLLVKIGPRIARKTE